ncbi:MAG: DUF3147 family protein [Gammaproteobacteria bacterium]|nr:DUF3147 family protein [Gammaproteobacteria bacterium]
MSWILIKLAVTTVLIVAISEIARRSTLAGGLLASLPVISVLAMVWLYLDTRDTDQVAALASSVFWLVIPSLTLFLSLPLLLKAGLGFWPGMGASLAITAGAYLLVVSVLGRLGVAL